MAIKAIIFDCFGVLVTPGSKALANDYPKFAGEISNLDHQADYGLISRKEYTQALTNLVGLSDGQIEDRYWKDSSVRVQSSFNWAKQLRQAGYKVGLLSNIGQGFFNGYFSDRERQELFDAVILSSEVGIAKPDVAIYEIMADKLGVKPDECVMVDDTQLNVEAAKNAGMRGVWFINTSQAKEEVNKILESKGA